MTWCIQRDIPASSFTENCTGDACVGDAVLYQQAVFGSYDVDTRGRGSKIQGECAAKKSYRLYQ